MLQLAKLDRYKDRLEDVKEIVGVAVAVVTIAMFVKKRVQSDLPKPVVDVTE